MTRILGLFVFWLMAAASGTSWAQLVMSGAGADAASIQSVVDQYRTALGTLNPNSVGSIGSGRREINWDGVPDAFAAPNFLPGNFFNSNSPRGAVFATPGIGVQVSADAANPTNTPVRFGNINASYSDVFKTFSAERLFSPIGSNIVDLTFFVPGTDTPAVTRGFGAVYTDVDFLENTAFEYFDEADKSLGTYSTPLSNNGLSFLGVLFDHAVVHRVRIQYGNVALGPYDGGAIDVAVMDDFIFGEPIAAPVAGDLNGDRAVDAADAGLLFANWGPVPPGNALADLNADGYVDAADAGEMFAMWTGDSRAATSVPEPAARLLVMCGLLSCRRRFG